MWNFAPISVNAAVSEEAADALILPRKTALGEVVALALCVANRPETRSSGARPTANRCLQLYKVTLWVGFS